MLSVAQIIKDAATSSSRFMSARAWVAWDRSQTSSEWFRLDQSALDSAAMLTLVSYLQGQTPNEIIADIDNFRYFEESDAVITAEGMSEMTGDNFQAVLSEADIRLSNDTDRYTPIDDKNILRNPSFESEYDDWNMKKETAGNWQAVGADTGVVSGSKAMRITNPNSESVSNLYLYSDNYTIESGCAYRGSIFARGTGNLTLRIVGIGSGGNTPVSTGSQTFAMQSGSWQRVSLGVSIPLQATYARLDVTTSSGVVLIDCAQLEQSNVMSDYEEDFIGDYILPRRPVKLQIEILDKPSGSGGDVPVFTGLTENFEPQLKENIVDIHCYDAGREFQDKYPFTTVSTGPSMYQNIRTDILIQELANMGGLASGDYILEQGKNTVPFFWIQEGSVWYYMSMLAEAEGGRVFFDEEGVLRFWNRDHLDNDTTSRFQFTREDNILDLSYRVDKDEIKNHIIVKANPREVQANQSIWKQPSSQEILHGEVITVWANMDDPFISCVTPTATGSASRFRANTESDNSGNDISSNIWLKSIYKFSKDVKMELNNQGSNDGYITELELWGQPAKVTKEIMVEKEDDDSIDTYGRQTLQIENDYIQNESYALNLASDKLFNLKDARDQIRLEVVGLPYLQIGDTVTVPEGWTGNVKKLFIKKKTWQIDQDGDYTQTLRLEKRTIAIFFMLDNSVLDGTDVLAV